MSSSLVSDREQVLEALAALSLERGYDEIRVDEIAARAGVTEARFRELFGDKETCAVEVENANLAAVIAAVSQTYSPDRSEWDSALRGVLAILEVMASKPACAYFGYVVARQMGCERVRGVYLSGHRMIVAMLERGWEYSRLEQQPKHAALAALGGAEALVRREVVAGRATELPNLLPDLVYSATVPFLGQREALRLAKEGRGLLTDR